MSPAIGLGMAQHSVQYQYQQFKDALNKSIINADVVKIFEYLLTIGVEEWASDIHVEPFENYSRIRIRIDGVLQELVQYPRTIHDSVISKFKIESWQMRPDEKRLPQDARVSSMTQTGKDIDLRASTLPTVWWEKLVMRIVDKSKKLPPLSELGIEWSNADIINRSINLPNGIVLTSWPTGSWKTTTLYAALYKINTVDVNVTTFEDPVENKMFGMNQSQVRSDIGFTFASGLRAALRQDPDIIMVWEIRDKETLEMSMEAAMTWHLVFSTIHTNGAAETLTRVFNLWAKPYMVAGTFNMVMAQRLGRKICPHCKQKVSIAQDPRWIQAKAAFADMDKNKLKNEILTRNITPDQWDAFINQWVVYHGTGKDPQTGDVCPVCKGTWAKGRTWLYEMMEYTDDVKNMLLNGKTAYEIERYELEKWMVNLERDGLFKMIKGEISLDEVYRIVKARKA